MDCDLLGVSIDVGLLSACCLLPFDWWFDGWFGVMGLTGFVVVLNLLTFLLLYLR